MTVRDILKEKGSAVYWVTPQTPLIDALKKLAEKNIGALLVLDKGKIVGIVSERDFVQHVAEMGSCQVDLPVSEFMTPEVMVVNPETSINETMQLMSRAHIRHLPIVDDGVLAGIISIGDVVRAVIGGQVSTIKGLENYIIGQSLMQ